MKPKPAALCLLALSLGWAAAQSSPPAPASGSGPAAQASALWEERAVPRGAISTHIIKAVSLAGQERPLTVYTPPGYEAAGQRKYPLLVLCHGRGDDETSWIRKGQAHHILDNLTAEGRIAPMVVLMMNGHPPVEVPPGTDYHTAALKAFQRELLEDALPFVEKTCRVLDGPENRAIAGLSMGGMQSVSTTLAFPDRFAWVGSFSGAHSPDGAAWLPLLEDPPKLNKAFRLLWFGCGTEDGILDRNLPHLALLGRKKVRHEWHLTAGGHTWDVWRSYLSEFLPRLFRS